MRRENRFVALWSLAVIATAASFILYLAMRSRAVELGYKLGKARQKQAVLRETRRVLQVEAVSYKNPERIEAVAKGVLRMEEPPPQRIFVVGAPIEKTEAAPPQPSAAPSATVKPLPSASAKGGPP